MKAVVSLTLAAVTLGGCALKGDVRRVERQLASMQSASQRENARRDSLHAAEIGRVIALLSAVQDSLAAQQRALTILRGELRSDLTEVQRQLVQVQELTGQSQQRLSELRTQLDQRGREPPPAPADAGAAGGAAAPSGLPGPDQLFDLGLQQLRRGSPGTARVAFQQFLQAYGSHARVPDALYFLGETWVGANADSASQAYEAVTRYPNSARAPGALYKLGLLAEQRGDRDAARAYYQRVLSTYPRSEEAPLAREKLRGSP
ncbi:MAG TPA: tetratricopeptide repeat protein [Gemmatimonadales bacterium]|nr:tetratricopeptide repeat protein [Gemmatimonadales bacterium]